MRWIGSDDMARSRVGTWNIKSSLRRVLKDVHPGYKISSTALETVSDLLWLVFQKLMKYINISKGEQKTLTSEKIHWAVRLFPGLLVKFASSDGDKAVKRYLSASKKGKRARIKAELALSVMVVRNSIKAKMMHERVGMREVVYMTGVLDYLAAEILELAGNVVREREKITIQARDIYDAIIGDEEHRELFQVAMIETGTMSSPLFRNLKD